MDAKQVKVIGGLLAFIGGFFILVTCMFSMINIDPAFPGSTPGTAVQWMLNVYLMSLALLGATLGLLSKRTGGILALLAGLTMVLLPLVAILLNDPDVALMFTQYSSFWGYSLAIPGFNLVVFETTVGSTTIFFSIESLLILAGGSLILIGDAKE